MFFIAFFEYPILVSSRFMSALVSIFLGDICHPPVLWVVYAPKSINGRCCWCMCPHSHL